MSMHGKRKLDAMHEHASSQLQLSASNRAPSQLLATGAWKAPGEVFKMFRCLKHARRNNKACTNCKKKKVGCDGQVPCGRCLKKGLQCGDGGDSLGNANLEQLTDRSGDGDLGEPAIKSGSE
eukprot:3935451-Rhodomonas_salina.1